MSFISSLQAFNARSNVLPVQIVSLALAAPLSLGTIHGMELSFAHLAAPASVLALLFSFRDKLTLLFLTAGICGLIAIAVAHRTYPGNLVGNVAELAIWTMAAPAFLFIGRALPNKALMFWVAVFSGMFLIVVTLPILLFGEPVRAMYLFDTPGKRPGTEFLNIRFFGFPVFATYGINSIAPLFCIQATTLCYGIATSRSWLRLLFAVGLFCAVFLVMGSNSRAAQSTMALLSIAVLVYCVTRRDTVTAIIVAVFALCAVLVTTTRDTAKRDQWGAKDSALPPMVNSRMIESARELSNAVLDNRSNLKADDVNKPDNSSSLKADDGNKPVMVDKQITMNEITTGRIDLWRAVALEIAQSPLIGNGFSGFGRFGPARPELAANTTAHNII